VRVLGLDPLADHAALSGRVGVMLQRGGVYPMLGPRRVLDLFAGYYPDPVPAGELLELVGLRAVAATPWRHLSGGEQQRLSLALALVGRPDVAFLDEPTAGVDPEGRIAVRAVVAGLREKGVCVLLTTHELGEAERMADRIAILSSGRVVLEGTPHGLTAGARGAAQPVVTFGAPPALDTAALAGAVGPGTVVTETAPGRYRVEAPAVTTPAVTAAVATFLAGAGATLTDLVAGKTLEDVYFEAVGAAAAADTPERSGSDEPVSSRRRGRRRGR
jgi:ABC-2 type transport system ATP-binding protein